MGFWAVAVTILVAWVLISKFGGNSGDDGDHSGRGPTQSDGREARYQPTPPLLPLHAQYSSTYGTNSSTGPLSSPNRPPRAVRIIRVVAAPAPPPPPYQETWVGDPLAAAAALREQASKEGDLMAKSFSQSRIYRESGFRAEAKALVKQGKEYQQKMESLNERASDMIFLEKNKNRELGLFVREAELKVKEALLAAEQRGDLEMRFIVGQGLHTADGKAKLKPALMCYIGQLGRSVRADPRNAGVLVVPLVRVGDDQEPRRKRNKRRARRGT
ncbi:hypothetical protein C8R43DRAFT_1123741 [Mycena crocata]|nr:hypothetical protein C8R43DRAFT_1123741 [Mycena crocata]